MKEELWLQEACQRAQGAAARSGQARLLRVHLASPVGEPWALCGRALWHLGPHMAWREAGHEMVGVGALERAHAQGPERFLQVKAAYRRWCELLHEEVLEGDLDAPLAWAGFGFTAEVEQVQAWDGWPAAELVLPQMLAYRDRAGRSCLALSTWVEPHSDPKEVASSLSVLTLRLRAALLEPTQAAEAIKRPVTVAAPEGDAWRWSQAVRQAREDFQSSELEKVVLARGVTVCAPARARFDALATLRSLRGRDPRPSGFVFCFGDVGRGDFVGATPESLVRVQGRQVETRALAGTAPRGRTQAEDHSLGRQLMESPKDRHEHALVSEAIEAALRPLCSRLEVDAQPRLARLPHVQHLETPVRGELAEDTHILDLVERLHPTPAVGGWPRQQALRWLHQHEGLRRGWYAAPVGWMDARGGGQFAVALRSALLRGQSAWAFAGAGLVDASDPDLEWQETRLKLQTIADALVASPWDEEDE